MFWNEPKKLILLNANIFFEEIANKIASYTGYLVVRVPDQNIRVEVFTL